MDHSAESVLLVDGNVDDRERYAKHLELLGFCTLQADNADDGFRLAAQMAPAVVITANRLSGGEDGFALTRRLKANVETRDAAVIVLSSSAADRYRSIAAQAECDRFVMKPCPPGRLGGVVQELLMRTTGPFVSPPSSPAINHRH